MRFRATAWIVDQLCEIHQELDALGYKPVPEIDELADAT